VHTHWAATWSFRSIRRIQPTEATVVEPVRKVKCGSVPSLICLAGESLLTCAHIGLVNGARCRHWYGRPAIAVVSAARNCLHLRNLFGPLLLPTRLCAVVYGQVMGCDLWQAFD
jgi:hypothetical protein